MYAYIMDKWAEAGIRTSVLITPKFYEACKTRHIRFSDALRVGIALMLAERGEIEYDNNLNLFRKMMIIKDNLEKTSQELNELKEKFKVSES